MSTVPVNHVSRSGSQAAAFATFFVAFSVCLLVLLYSFGTMFYDAINIEVPLATSWFQYLVPWPLVGIAVVTTVAMLSFKARLSQSRVTKVSWVIIVGTALFTLWGAFQIVSPMIGVLSGLGEI